MLDLLYSLRVRDLSEIPFSTMRVKSRWCRDRDIQKSGDGIDHKKKYLSSYDMCNTGRLRDSSLEDDSILIDTSVKGGTHHKLRVYRRKLWQKQTYWSTKIKVE